MKRAFLILMVILAGLFLVTLSWRATPADARLGDQPAPTSTKKDNNSTPDTSQVEQAVLESVAAHAETRIIYATNQFLVTDIQVDDQAQWATAFLVPYNPQTGETSALEPGLVILNWDGTRWIPALPGDANWTTWLHQVPSSLVSPEMIDYWNSVSALTNCFLPQPVYNGFYLPYEYGKTGMLTQSLFHDLEDKTTCTQPYTAASSCPQHYTYDFANVGNVQMFNVWSTRSGSVVSWKDTIPNYDHSDWNYILIKDDFYPLYVLYLHLAQNSIPAELKTVGAHVNRARFIAVADDTGFSSGSHLHLQVEKTPPNVSGGGWFGCSVDITFNDVSINGGRPRLSKAVGGGVNDTDYCYSFDVCSQFQKFYKSGNNPGDPDAPTADFSNITSGDQFTTPVVTLSGWGADQTSGFAHAQFVAGVNGFFQPIGPVFTQTPFTANVDICAVGAANGPLDLGIRVADKSGNELDLLPLRTVLQNVQCPAPPQPACTPGPGQVALFADANYAGACKVFGPAGAYQSAALPSVGVGTASSVLVGTGARVGLYTLDNFAGREETLSRSDSNLADNRIQDDSVASIIVQSVQDPPFGPQPVWPADNQVMDGSQSGTFYWNSGAGDEEYQVKVTISSTEVITSSWLAEPWLSFADLNLKPGKFTWQVRSRGQIVQPGWFTPTAWTPARTFTLNAGAYVTNTPINLTTIDETVPNATWTATGWWHSSTMATPVQAGTPGYWYAGNEAIGVKNYDLKRSSSLTSAPINLPANKTAYMNFWYYYQTEGQAADVSGESPQYWDQRKVQVVLADGHVETLYQFAGDVMQAWKQSPYISLAKYAGQTVRLRFYFDTIDGMDNAAGVNNNFTGWFVDNIHVDTTTPAVCSADAYEGAQGNNTPATAFALSSPFQVLSSARICQNDLDYYRFEGKRGDLVQISTDTQLNPPSPLDSVIELLDSDGSSVLAYNDDNPFTGKLDSWLQTTLPRDGSYYVRVHSFSYPNVYKSTPADNGQSRLYDFHFAIDPNNPLVSSFSPASNTRYPKNPIQLSADVTPSVSGLSKVEFFWHNSDWTSTNWTSLGLGVLKNGAYTLQVDPNTIGNQPDMAFYVRATNLAGGTAAAGAFHIATDTTPPVTGFDVIPPVQTSNAYQVSWNGTDALSGIDHFVIDAQVDGGAWSSVYTSTQLTSLWRISPPGHIYGFRMTSVDRAGNQDGSHIITTTIPSAASLCATATDLYEPDNNPLQAHFLQPGVPQEHTFCNPSNPDFSADSDWITTTVTAGHWYGFMVSLPLNGQVSSSGAAPVLSLFAANGVTLLKEATPGSFPAANLLLWRADRSGPVVLRVKNLDPGLLAAGYSLRVYDAATLLYMPLMK